jgi:predicted acylesterase/phospholipase RssA
VVIEKHALYFAPLAVTLDDMLGVAGRAPWLKVEQTEAGPIWRGQNLALRLDVATTVAEALERVRGRYYSGIILDTRHPAQHLDAAPAQEQAVYELLDGLDREPDRERRFPFRRTVVLVGDSDRERVDQLIFSLGRRQVGGCLRDRSLNYGLKGDEAKAARDRVLEQLWQFCAAMMVDRPRGKKAICAAGGGITGIYYELGVLKCLNDAFGGFDIRDFDLFFGISAGAFVTSFVANHFHIDDLIANIGGLREDWPYELRLGWHNLNLREIPRRLSLLQRKVLTTVGEIATGRRELGITSVFSNYSLPFGPMFDHADLEVALREQFRPPKHTNDFRKLSRQLFIGVTDQDRREHVLLGDTGYEDVPISLAVQASSAIHPFFPSVEIQGRRYTDGAITKTSNINSAIEKGADLIFVIDPFVPLISEEAGFNARHGNLWVLQQDIKTLAYTRFAQVSEEIMRRHPNVSCYTFVPSNRMRELMTQNPLAAENFHPIVSEAYASTYRRLAQLEFKIAGELAAHGITLELKKVADKVAMLKRNEAPDARILLA